MTETTELEIRTTLTGALATRLIQRAAAIDKSPVELACALVEHALTSELYNKLFEENIRLKAANKIVQRKADDAIADYRRLVRQLPQPGSISISPSVHALNVLNDRAGIYKLSVDALVLSLVEHVANDDLFTAVLDK